jgi:hypothetical protein
MKSQSLIVSKEYFHHHSDGILTKYGKYRKFIIDNLNGPVQLETIERKRKAINYPGYGADSLNEAVRVNLRKINNIKFEVQEHDGVFYYEGKTGGFDFALIDDVKNLYQLRNLCFGRRSLNNGLNHWQKEIKKNATIFSEIIANYGLLDQTSLGKDLDHCSSEPLIVGEIQFGNWGLVYRDLFKVLKANTLLNVDVLVYIVATGRLHKGLSDSIVSFESTKEILEEFKKVISVPIWLIGIDIKD